MGNQINQPQPLSIAYGQYQLIIQNQVSIAIKQYEINSQQQRKSFKHLIKIVSQINIPTTIKITACKQHQNIFEVHYKFIKYTLRDSLQESKIKNYNFSEIQILNMLDCILSALLAYQYKNLYFGDLRPQRILVQITQKSSLYIIGLPILLNNLTMTQISQKKLIPVYLAPQFLQDNNLNISIEKGDVYSLGIIALQMATLENYKNENRKIRNSLKKCREQYSEDFTQLIQQMITQNFNMRPNFNQIHKKLQQLLQMNQKYNQSQISSNQKPILIESNYNRNDQIFTRVESTKLLQEIFIGRENKQVWKKFCEKNIKKKDQKN